MTRLLVNATRRIILNRYQMASSLSPIEQAKRTAAYDCGKKNVGEGCKLGVGSGSTVKYLVDYLKEEYKSGKLQGLSCVPTSYQTKRWLLDAGLPVSDLEQTPELDACIDGADEVDAEFTCIKGGGGCLAQEKIVQNAAKKFFVIADSSKESKKLGENYKQIPIEVLPFAAQPLLRSIPTFYGGECGIRMAVKKCGPVITDNNNYIIDWIFPKEKKLEWSEVQMKLANTPGVVETGLFIDVVNKVYFAYSDGTVKELQGSKH